jgi:hypothetical protein
MLVPFAGLTRAPALLLSGVVGSWRGTGGPEVGLDVLDVGINGDRALIVMTLLLSLLPLTVPDAGLATLTLARRNSSALRIVCN